MGYRPMVPCAKKEGAGWSATQRHSPEAATQTFKRGALLIYSSGYTQEAGSDPALSTIAGIATRAGQNKDAATDPEMSEFIPWNECGLIEANFDDTTGTLALAAAHMGVDYGLVKDGTTGNWYIDQTDETNVRVRIVGFKDPVGTVNARVYAEPYLYAP